MLKKLKKSKVINRFFHCSSANSRLYLKLFIPLDFRGQCFDPLGLLGFSSGGGGGGHRVARLLLFLLQ